MHGQEDFEYGKPRITSYQMQFASFVNRGFYAGTDSRFVKGSKPFLTVEAIIGNQAF